MITLDKFEDVFLISSGAMLGANIRFIVYKKLQKIDSINSFTILIINIFSSFLLGFFLAISSNINSLNYMDKLGLFFSIGLLGSLSTFSTFIYDLYELFLQLKFFRAFKIFIISLVSGILFFAVGFLIGI